MIYVFDSSPLIDLFRYYYPDRFPSLWENVTTQTGRKISHGLTRIGRIDTDFRRFQVHADKVSKIGVSLHPRAACRCPVQKKICENPQNLCHPCSIRAMSG